MLTNYLSPNCEKKMEGGREGGKEEGGKEGGREGGEREGDRKEGWKDAKACMSEPSSTLHSLDKYSIY